MSATMFVAEIASPISDRQMKSPRVKIAKPAQPSASGKRRPSRGSVPIPAKSRNAFLPHSPPLGSSPRTPPRRSVWLEEQPSERYAGPKFSSPPHPSALPQPPAHWLEDNAMGEIVLEQSENKRCLEIERHLRKMLKV